MARMDYISELPEELLLRILSLLPTRDVVATMVLSKRWQFLWSLVPRLVYDDSNQDIEYGSFSRFVDRSLLLHEAPVLEFLHFKLGQKSGEVETVDIGVWTRTAVKRCVRELVIEIDCSCTAPVILPRSLYTGCRMLVTLKLNHADLYDLNSSSMVSFPSLKTLSLVSVVYPDDEFVNTLLSSCHVLEDLDVEQCPYDNVTVFAGRVPSLKSLVLRKSEKRDLDEEDGFVIDAPSLEYLKIIDYVGGFCVTENNMPNIVEASVDVSYLHPVKILLGSITSVERLDLCLLTSKDAYPVGSVFHCLVHLRLCTCKPEWLNLLMCLLRDSPNLQALKLEQCHDLVDEESCPCWNERALKLLNG